MRAERTETGTGTPFDRAIELQELRRAAAEYAARHGEPGSIAYCAAWLRFRQRVTSIDDLRRVRAKANGAKRAPRSTERANAAGPT